MRFLPAFIFLILSVQLYSQDFVIDLAHSQGDTVRLPVEAGRNVQITLLNKIPLASYNTIVKKKRNQIAPIAIQPEMFKKDDAVEGDVMGYGDASPQPCPIVYEALEMFSDLPDERDVPLAVAELDQVIKNLREEVQASGGTTDEGCRESHVQFLDDLRRSTSKRLAPVKIGKGETVEVSITRNTANETKRWVYILEGPKRGSWDIGYGFTFVTNLFNKEGSYYLSQQDSTFRITPINSRKHMELVPTIMFAWTPEMLDDSQVSVSLAGGLGFDFSRPVVMLGISFSYNRNLNVNLGVAAHEQKHLHGRYEEGQLLKELVSDESLHENLYRLNPTFSVTYRFNGSPF